MQTAHVDYSQPLTGAVRGMREVMTGEMLSSPAGGGLRIATDVPPGSVRVYRIDYAPGR